MTNFLKKIAPKTIGAQKVGDGYKLFGKISQMKHVSTPMGESVQFFGMFRAIVDETGEVFEGISTFLPGGYDGIFAQSLKDAQDAQKGAAIEIAVHFHKREATNAMGAEWIMSNLSKNAGSATALDELQASALPSPKEQLKLEAPKKKKLA